MEARWHFHPETGLEVFGTLIEKGTRLEKDDVYDSTSGKWEKCPCPGAVLQTSEPNVIWIRPCSPRKPEQAN
ncbi:MAG: hypothetical protein UV01_C0001G0045 [Parcubacteria group bacterium GW2011_GWA2_42_14]|nr:MAG: hypothetical protein UV01_C0001G0045 [Parcubacteria group bacterium GW2011_GWA2_42_14]